VLTARARAVLVEHDRVRLDYFAEMLEDWTPTELQEFAGMLARFTDTYENANNTMISERLMRGAARPGGNT
jgi:hypothetical protein